MSAVTVAPSLIALTDDERATALAHLAQRIAEDALSWDRDDDLYVIATCLRAWASGDSLDIAYLFEQAVDAAVRAVNDPDLDTADDVTYIAGELARGRAHLHIPYRGSSYPRPADVIHLADHVAKAGVR